MKLSCKINPEDIYQKADEALRIFTLKDYEERFSWVKTKRSVTNPLDIDRLNERLVEDLASSATTNIHLAPPSIIDWDDIDGFLYLHEQESSLHTDLDLSDYLARHDDLSKLSVENLKNHVIRVKYSSRTSERLAPVYKCLVAEIDLESQKYILSAGRWFRINQNLVDEIEEKLKQVVVHDSLPDATSFDQKEGDYNQYAASMMGALCLDKVPLRPRDAASNVELCDILTEDLEFIHVKKRESSSTLSHLYAQGFVSAQSIVWEPTYRTLAAAAIRDMSGESAVLAKWDGLRPGDIHVVYAIIAESRFEGKERLPFFSKVSLLNAVESLKRLQFKTSVAHVHRPDKPSN